MLRAIREIPVSRKQLLSEGLRNVKGEMWDRNVLLLSTPPLQWLLYLTLPAVSNVLPFVILTIGPEELRSIYFGSMK